MVYCCMIPYSASVPISALCVGESCHCITIVPRFGTIDHIWHNSTLPQAKTLDVTIGASSILNFTALSLTLFMTLGAYTLPSHPIKMLLTLHHQDLWTTRKPNVSRPTAFDGTVTVGCYGLLWLFMQQSSYYTAASAM